MRGLSRRLLPGWTLLGHRPAWLHISRAGLYGIIRVPGRKALQPPSDAPSIDERDGEQSQNEPTYERDSYCTKLRLTRSYRRAPPGDHGYVDELSGRNGGPPPQSSDGQR